MDFFGFDTTRQQNGLCYCIICSYFLKVQSELHFARLFGDHFSILEFGACEDNRVTTFTLKYCQTLFKIQQIKILSERQKNPLLDYIFTSCFDRMYSATFYLHFVQCFSHNQHSSIKNSLKK